jgi:uncharacterized membrane protein YphA (DoxX/SURF4 family)
MLAGIFVAGGAQALANPDPLAPRAKRVTERVEPVLKRLNEKAPTDPRTLVRFNAAVQLTAGLLLVTRLRRPAALALAGTLVPTTLAGHPFWEDQDREQRRQQQTHFMKNLGLFGGLLLAATDTEGRPGLRWRARRAAHDANRAVRRSAKHLAR